MRDNARKRENGRIKMGENENEEVKIERKTMKKKKIDET